MFGYVRINKPELKIREYSTYKGLYCGICMALKENFGEISRLSLNYDMTFLQLVLTSLYEPKSDAYMARCIAHPHKKEMIIENEISLYCAAMNVILSYFKLEDDINDDKSFKAMAGKVGISRAFKKAKAMYPEKTEFIKEKLEALYKLESEKSDDIDKLSSEFGHIMGELFRFKDDVFGKVLYRLGFNLGKYIYIVDAFEDVKEDIEKNRYNPFSLKVNEESFKEWIKDQVRFMLSCVDRELDMLPIIVNKGIIDNIVYSGIVLRFEQALGERLEEIEEEI